MATTPTSSSTTPATAPSLGSSTGLQSEVKLWTDPHQPAHYSDKTNPNYLKGLVSDILLTKGRSGERPNPMPLDATWVRQAFVIPRTGTLPDLDPDDARNRSFSSASLKYTDSSLGGNICINPPPQFTRYADVPDKGIRQGATDMTVDHAYGEIGMGRYYSEAIDDNNQLVHLRFGVAQYNSLFQFFTGFYSSSAGSAARAGRFDPGFLKSFLGMVGTAVAMAIAPLAIVPVAILMFGSAVRFFMKWPTSKFYTLKPSMPMYWNAVTSLVNQIGVNQGTINYMEPKQKEQILGQEKVFDNAEASIFSTMMPGIMSKHGTIDVYAVANRAKRLQERHEALKLAAFKNAGNKDFFGVVKEVMGGLDTPVRLDTSGPHTSLEAYLQRFVDFVFLSRTKGSDGIEKELKSAQADKADLTAEETARTKDQPASTTPEGPPSDGLLAHFIADLADGSDWVSFRVDYTGAVQESFNSSVAESSLAQKINSVSSSARDIRMNLSGGVLGGVVDAVGSVLSEIGSVLHLEGLAATAGSCFVDIPKHWDTSSASLPSANYSLTLISPYGNPVSKMFNIYIPLAMLLAGCLPLATGKQSHTSPFLCELHDRGRVLTRLGIIDKLSISRGTSNLGFNNEGQAMAVDVTFSVLDLSTIVAMPIQPGFSFMPAEGLFDAENAFTDYLMALSGMKLRDTVDRFPMLKYQVANKMAQIDTFFSAAHFSQYASGLPGVSSLSMFMSGATNRK